MDELARRPLSEHMMSISICLDVAGDASSGTKKLNARLALKAVIIVIHH